LKCVFRSSILCFQLAVRLLLLAGRSSGSEFGRGDGVSLYFLGLYNRLFQSDFSLLFQLILFPVFAEDFWHNLVSLAYSRQWNMWLFDIVFSKNSYNGILSLACGHKEMNFGNVHIAFSFAHHG
jgi:hypothetical protein